MSKISSIDFNSNIEINESSAESLILSLTENDLFVFSPTSLELIDNNIAIKAQRLDSTTVGIVKKDIESFIKNKSFKKVVSLGNGKTTDVAKYISSILKIELISIPAAFTTNVFFTNKACLLDSGDKKTFSAKIPDRLIIDFKILEKVPFKYHMYGLCDVLSIHTAIFDWKLSTRRQSEKIDPFLVDFAEFILKQLIKNKKNILKKNRQSLKLITELIMLSGYVTNIAGSGRPESGSEHIIASFFEKKIDTFHAVGVTAGILLSMKLQKNEKKVIISMLKDLGLLEALLSDGRVIDDLNNLPAKIKPRNDRYTILNEKNITDKHIKDLLSFLNKKI